MKFSNRLYLISLYRTLVKKNFIIIVVNYFKKYLKLYINIYKGCNKISANISENQTKFTKAQTTIKNNLSSKDPDIINILR